MKNKKRKSKRKMPVVDHVRGGAEFSSCKQYCYLLWRELDTLPIRADEPLAPIVTFVMLNPSTADANTNDATVRRCMRFAQLMGYTRLWIVNLFAYRATQPRDLYTVYDPVGPKNDEYIRDAVQLSDRVVIAWGNHGTHANQADAVIKTVAQNNDAVYHFGLTQRKQPKHPLYLPNESPLYRLEKGG